MNQHQAHVSLWLPSTSLQPFLQAIRDAEQAHPGVAVEVWVQDTGMSIEDTQALLDTITPAFPFRAIANPESVRYVTP